MAQVFDIKGIERDWAYLWGRYGRLELRPAGGRPSFELAQVRECAGPAVLRVRVLDAEGAPLAARVALTWPTVQTPAEDLPPVDGAVAWASRAVTQVTDAASGETTFALGRDSWIKDLATGGPYHVWVQWYGDSECLSWVGWLGGTDHQGPCDLTFRLAPAETLPEPEPEPDAVVDQLRTIAEDLERLAAGLRALLPHLVRLAEVER